MFTATDLKCLDREYFDIIRKDDYDVMVISKNTCHVWCIHNSEWPENGSCVVFHSHGGGRPLHLQWHCSSLQQAVRRIKGHDEFQMNGRRPVKKKRRA